MISLQNSNVYKILINIGCDIDSLKELHTEFFENKDQQSDYTKLIPLSQNSDFILRQSLKWQGFRLYKSR